jgi:5-methylcytosine-specific restriction enzyme A
MPTAPTYFRPRGAPERAAVERAADERRGSARARGYTGRWDKARRTFLAAHPLCEYCAVDDRPEPATLVDHLYPHRTYPGTFWRTDLWVACCAGCHAGMKQSVETRGRAALDTLATRLGRTL